MGRSRSRSPSRQRSRRRHSRYSSSSCSNSSTSTVQRKAKRPKLSKEERRRMKDIETPEERRARRLAKKARKDAKRKKQEQTLNGYTDEANPFNDKHLSEVFIWNKKYEKEISSGKDARKLVRERLKKQQRQTQADIGELRKRREQREREQRELDSFREQLEREARRESNDGWDRKEETFIKEQVRVRSLIRIRERRERPVDLLAKNLFIVYPKLADIGNKYYDELEVRGISSGLDVDVELTEPHLVFIGLEASELDDLKDDIDGFLELGEFVKYWGSLRILAIHALEQSKSASEASSGAIAAVEAVKEQIDAFLKGKPTAELEALQSKAASIVDGSYRSEVGHEMIDVDFWQALHNELRISAARSYLREAHRDMLRLRLEQLTSEQTTAIEEKNRVKPELEVKNDETEIFSSNAAVGAWSPALFSLKHEALLEEAVTPEQDRAELAELRALVVMQMYEKHVQGGNRVAPLDRREDEAMLDQEAALGMDEDEEQFGDLVALKDEVYWWHDKYRPRKPRFFNRVKTGYDWSKYNQTHYSTDNPPPKVVQGYKFNIFYPDLIDPSKPPTFRVEPTHEPDFCILRFQAGPPYEDVAFKIVKGDWQVGSKNGHKCKFERGILHLYFNFKRYRYRR